MKLNVRAGFYEMFKAGKEMAVDERKAELEMKRQRALEELRHGNNIELEGVRGDISRENAQYGRLQTHGLNEAAAETEAERRRQEAIEAEERAARGGAREFGWEEAAKQNDLERAKQKGGAALSADISKWQQQQKELAWKSYDAENKRLQEMRAANAKAANEQNPPVYDEAAITAQAGTVDRLWGMYETAGNEAQTQSVWGGVSDYYGVGGGSAPPEGGERTGGDAVADFLAGKGGAQTGGLLAGAGAGDDQYGGVGTDAPVEERPVVVPTTPLPEPAPKERKPTKTEAFSKSAPGDLPESISKDFRGGASNATVREQKSIVKQHVSAAVAPIFDIYKDGGRGDSDNPAYSSIMNQGVMESVLSRLNPVIERYPNMIDGKTRRMVDQYIREYKRATGAKIKTLSQRINELK